MPEKPEEMLTFTAPSPPTDPVTFSINSETFIGIPFLPGSRFLHFSRVFDTATAGLVSTLLVEEFFNEILDAPERERFWKFCNEPSSGITATLLSEMFLSLFARYSSGPEERSRPTEPPRPSQSGRSKTRASSKESGSSPESTPPDTPPSR